MGSRLTWPEIRQIEEYQGRWVALDHCRYDSRTAQPLEGSVVDSDEDLAELCSRIKQNESRHCAILFCTAHEERITPLPPSPRAFTH
jgi:hypothetical protein